MKKLILALLSVLMILTISGCTPPKEDEPEPTQSDYIPLDKLESDISEATLVVGEQIQLEIKLVPDSATDKGLVYKSLNTSVAMVNETGLVVAVKEGQTDIMVISETNGMINLPIHIIVKNKESDPAPTPTPEPEPTPEPTPEPEPEPVKKVLFSYTNIRSDINPEYYPKITFYDNGEFEFYENIYEGMVTYYGTYSIEYGQDITAYPDYIRVGQNSSPADLAELKFTRMSDKYMIMHSEAYLSEYGDIFVNGADTAELAYTYGFPMDGIDKSVETRIEIYTDRSFILYENFYAGIDEVHGVFYTNDGITYIFTPTLIYSNSGFEYKQFRCQESMAGFQALDDIYQLKPGDAFTEWENHLAG